MRPQIPPDRRGASEQEHDAIVVGAGVIGLSLAWRAARAGLRVAVVDQVAPGSGASRAAAGMLAPVTEADFGEQRLIDLNLEGAARFPSFAAELEAQTGMPVGYSRTGTLSVAVDRDQLEELERLHQFQRSLGLEVERLSPRECRRLEPGLATRVAGGIHAPGDHQVSARLLVAALLVALEHAGVTLHAATKGTALLVDDDTVVGVTPGDAEPLLARQVVVAAGAGSGSIAGLPPHARLPVRPVKGQVLRLRGAPGQLAARVIRTPAVYAVPRAGGTVVVGATMEERGWDQSVTVGGVLELLRRAYEVLPGVTELELVEACAGLRPTLPDNHPALGRGALRGLVWATGHWRNGVLLAPITADAVTALLTGADVPAIWKPFGPARFAPSADQPAHAAMARAGTP